MISSYKKKTGAGPAEERQKEHLYLAPDGNNVKHFKILFIYS